MRAATKSGAKSTSRKSGDNSEEVTPVPISNTVVKLLSADDTWWEAAWESRTLPVFYYLDLRMIEIKNCALVRLFYYLDLGKIERKNCARSVKHVRASFLFAQIFLLCRRYCLAISPKYRQKHLAKRRLMDECHMRIEISDFVMRAFVPIQRKDSSHAVFFHFGNVSTFRKYGFLRSSMRHRRKEGNHETCRAAPARYMDVAGFFLP